jgi:hypothetical protein
MRIAFYVRKETHLFLKKELSDPKSSTNIILVIEIRFSLVSSSDPLILLAFFPT